MALKIPQQQDWLQKMPKVELHAHLNGSLSTAGILELGESLYGTHTTEFLQLSKQFTNFDGLSLDDCFLKFQFMHQMTATRGGLQRATEMVIRDFARDNVIHLELRTTPKANAHMTKREYLECVLDVLQRSKQTLGISVKLLPSIDRSKSVAEGAEMLRLVKELRKTHAHLIPGIDLSGNPRCGSFTDFLPVLQEARRSGLKLTLHCAEVDNTAEVEQMLHFGMERCGHGTFLSTEQVQQLGRRNSAIECCLTSNVKCGTVPRYDDHHFRHIFHSNTAAVVLCTDDSGVFDTTLTHEFELAVKAFNLSSKEVMQLVLNAVEHAFVDVDERERLRSTVTRFFESKRNP